VNEERATIAYRFWNMMRNCGDAVSSYVLDRALNIEPIYVWPERPHLCAVGSIIQISNRNSYIWGSGILNPGLGLPDLDASRIRAVRGKRSLDHLRKQGLAVGNIPLGDPGIFVSDVLAWEGRTLSTRYRAAVVPHHSALKQEEFARYRNSDEFCFVNMIDSSLDPARQIAMSDVVISQSLHGLVFAEALGKPSVWISHSAHPDWCFKFEDWYSTTEYPQSAPLPLSTSVAELLKQCRRAESTIDRVALRGSLPREICEHRSTRDVLPYMACRERRVAIVDLDPDVHLDAIGDVALDEKRRAEFQWRVSQSFKSAFASWAEPAYAALTPPASEMNPRDADAATDYLDWNLGFEFALLAKPVSRSTGDWASTFEVRGRHFGITTDIPRNVTSVVLRPHGWFSLKSSFVGLVPLTD